MKHTTERVRPTYEPFSREPEYVEVNRLFLRGLDLLGSKVIADLACGTGAITALILEELAGLERAGAVAPTVIGVELSAEALNLAARRLADSGRYNHRRVVLLQASADRLPLPDASTDVAVIGNAIHLMEDKERLTAEVHRILRPGGIFAFNTSFYAGAYLSGTERFYLRWMEEALEQVSQLGPPEITAGGGRASRRRGAVPPAFSNRWLSPSEYTALLERHGFDVFHVLARSVRLTRHSFETIGAYAGLASVLLSGYRPTLACEALRRAAGPALEASGLDAVPRGWLEVCGRRESTGEPSREESAHA